MTYLTDALGSTIRLTNAAGDKVVDYSYDPYRNTKADAVVNNSFQYTGRENDGTGLYYYRARYYSPATNRFISEDPIGLNGGINTYGYVGGNPISFTDPSGLKVVAVLDTKKNTLTITNINTNETIEVQAFTGGHVIPTKGKIVSPGVGVKVPAPAGSYYIVDNPNPKPGHEDWFGLFRKDDRVDDYFEHNGKTRSGVRLHLGGVSWGCVTVNKYEPGAQEKWKKIQDMLDKTRVDELEFSKGPHWWNSTSTTINYGTLTIK